MKIPRLPSLKKNNPDIIRSENIHLEYAPQIVLIKSSFAGAGWGTQLTAALWWCARIPWGLVRRGDADSAGVGCGLRVSISNKPPMMPVLPIARAY